MAERTRKAPPPPPRDALASLRALLDGLTPEEIKAPRVPISSLTAEALALSVTAESVRDALLAKGLDPDHLEHLPVLARSLAMAQAELDAGRGPKRTEEELALEARAVALRAEIVAAGRFALRTNEQAQAQLNAVQKGKGLDDLAQDLRDLAAFAERYAPELTKINAEPARQAALARELSITLADRVARRRGSIDGTSEVREVRDRIATLLIETMAEIRAAGAYAFRKDPRLLAKFRSPYNGEKRGRRARSDEPLGAPPAEGRGRCQQNPGVAPLGFSCPEVFQILPDPSGHSEARESIHSGPARKHVTAPSGILRTGPEKIEACRYQVRTGTEQGRESTPGGSQGQCSPWVRQGNETPG